VICRFFPSFRAHSGLILVSNIKMKNKNKSDVFERLVVRVYEANHCRNMYPITRIAYATQDPFFEYFYKTLALPRNIPRKLMNFVSEIEVRNIVVAKRDDFFLDLDVSEQVEMEFQVDDMIDKFHEEFEIMADEDLRLNLRACLYYPKYVMKSMYFRLLRGNSYVMRTDSFFDKYKDIIIVIDREENECLEIPKEIPIDIVELPEEIIQSENDDDEGEDVPPPILTSRKILVKNKE